MADPVDRFLARAGWDGARRAALAGDASSRRYVRLFRPDRIETSVLMMTGPDAAASNTAFLKIAGHLESHGFSAPRILARDPANGMILLEDLGDALVARLCDDDPTREPALYAAAVDTLAALARTPCPEDLPRYTPSFMAAAVDPAFDWYAPGADAGPVRDRFAELLTRHADRQDSLGLRDFHAENLIWLPDRRGVARMGLLDFQDAMAGHPAYDLASLIQDARRDLSPGLDQSLIRRFSDATGLAHGALVTAVHVLGAQRNLRILGIFAALSQRDGKSRYIDMIPRVWGHLMTCLAHPALADIEPVLKQALPPPHPAYLSKLRSPCRMPS